MVTRRFWVDGQHLAQSAQKLEEDDVFAPLVWRCRTLWYQVRCGKPGVAVHVDGLPDFALVPLAAAGDAQGNLREMECEMVALSRVHGDVADILGRLHAVRCETRKGHVWIVSITPRPGTAQDVVEACHRFGNYFNAALRMDEALH